MDVRTTNVIAQKRRKTMSKAMSAREIFKLEFGNSKNFMTPNVLKVGNLNRNVAYEISSGIGMDMRTLYGLSIVEALPDGTTRRVHKYSGCFDSLSDVEYHLREISEMYQEIKGEVK